MQHLAPVIMFTIQIRGEEKEIKNAGEDKEIMMTMKVVMIVVVVLMLVVE